MTFLSCNTVITYGLKLKRVQWISNELNFLDLLFHDAHGGELCTFPCWAMKGLWLYSSQIYQGVPGLRLHSLVLPANLLTMCSLSFSKLLINVRPSVAPKVFHLLLVRSQALSLEAWQASQFSTHLTVQLFLPQLSTSNAMEDSIKSVTEIKADLSVAWTLYVFPVVFWRQALFSPEKSMLTLSNCISLLCMLGNSKKMCSMIFEGPEMKLSGW